MAPEKSGDVGRRTVERDGRREPFLTGVEEVPGHAAAEAEPDDADVGIGDSRRSSSMPAPRSARSCSTGAALRAAGAPAGSVERGGTPLRRQQIHAQRGVTVGREAAGEVEEVRREAAVLVDEQHRALR